MKKIPHTFRLSPESLLKLKILSIVLHQSQAKILDSIVNNIWEENQTQITNLSEEKVSEITRKIIERLVVE